MTRYWCMRFEAKHNYFQDLAHRTKQFKNIAIPLSYHHQQLVATNSVNQNLLLKECKQQNVFYSMSFTHTFFLRAHRASVQCK